MERENKIFGQNKMSICRERSQGQTQRAVVSQKKKKKTCKDECSNRAKFTPASYSRRHELIPMCRAVYFKDSVFLLLFRQMHASITLCGCKRRYSRIS